MKGLLKIPKVIASEAVERLKIIFSMNIAMGC